MLDCSARNRTTANQRCEPFVNCNEPRTRGRSNLSYNLVPSTCASSGCHRAFHHFIFLFSLIFHLLLLPTLTPSNAILLFPLHFLISSDEATEAASTVYTAYLYP